ncbi:hypothetical protein ACL02U_13435 [Streptomyces sp. MS06]|uniref:hypothetical protein n=1 Tax=Streptomyces sp. MS06 TaxID=3385974 RepID=UPI0039A33770
MKIEPGYTYLLKNDRSGRVVSPQAFSTAEAQTLQQLNLRTDPGQRKAQVWHAMPLDDGYVLFVNKKSARVMSPQAFSQAEAQTLQQLNIRTDPGHRNTQQWEAMDDGNRLLLRNRISGRVVSPQAFSTAEAQTLQQLNIRADANQRAVQRWELVVDGEDRRVTELPPVDREVNEIGDVDRLTGFAKPPKDRTDEVLVGQSVIPFLLVNDGGVDQRPWQSETNPYYLLKRFGYWEQVFYYEHSGNSEYTEKQTTTLGLTTGNQHTIEETVSITVGMDAGFAFKGLTASMSTSITTGLRVERTSYSEEESSETVEITRRYESNGKRVAEAVWYRGDRYSLQRLDGTQLMEWRTINDQMKVNDSYPAG